MDKMKIVVSTQLILQTEKRFFIEYFEDNYAVTNKDLSMD